MCVVKGRRLVAEALKNFSPRADHAPHHPEAALITCIDARLAAGGHYSAYADKTLRITEIAAIIPEYTRAPANMKAKLSFQKVKDIGCIKLEGHSFCGGAQTVFDYPRPEDAPDYDIGDIVQSVAESGADLPRLRDAFMKACEGDAIKGANLMARHLVLVSTKNVLDYPGIRKRIMQGRMELLPVFHVLKQDDPNEYSYLELFDVNEQKWKFVHDEDGNFQYGEQHQNSPETSTTYERLIARSVEWVDHDVLHEEQIQLPRHISDLLKERAHYYQPQHSYEQSLRAGQHNQVCGYGA